MIWANLEFGLASNPPALDQRILIGSIAFTSTLGLIVQSRSALMFVSEHFGYIEIISLLITDDNAIMHTIDNQYVFQVQGCFIINAFNSVTFEAFGAFM